ncbi:enhanced intracellular survival protein Eis [Enterococcus sp. 2201sp1_2201st1_B8_2201SCRN_220225]|uniref:GNAT family N-acetyltransferase n=1 Tax=unclassified Enterococcus TaxID=2608891 RepID=UPI0034A0F22F
MKISQFNESEFQQSIALRKYVFRSPYTKAKAADYQFLLQIADSIGAFDDQGRLLGQVLNLPIFYNFYGQKVPAVGVNHVGVFPETRGQGVAGKLMKASLQQAYQRGQVLSILQPFSVAFYRKYGFDLFATRIHYQISKELFPQYTHENVYRIERWVRSEMSPSLMKVLCEVYEQFAQKRNGTQIRDTNWWRRMDLQFPELNYAVIYQADVCVGYLSYRIVDTNLEIIDFIYENSQAAKELWNFASAHQSNVFQICGTTTNAESINYSFADPRIDQRLWYNTMIRIVDLPQFLKLWFAQFPAVKSFTFSVIDSVAPWNSGCYQISGDTVSKSVTEKLDSDLVDIRELAAIFLGPLTKGQLKEHLDDENRPYLEPLLISAENKLPAHFLGEF